MQFLNLSNKRYIICLTSIILIYLISSFYIYSEAPGFRSWGCPNQCAGDPALDANQILPGKNFIKYGFANRSFLADYSTDFEDEKPFYYTHNPSLNELFNAAIQYVGFDTIEKQRPIAILISTLALIFLTLSILFLTRSKMTSLLFSFFLISNPFYIYWADNISVCVSWFLFSFGLYTFSRLQNYTNSKLKNYHLLSYSCFRNPNFWLCWLSIFLLTYSRIETVPLLCLSLFFLYIFKFINTGFINMIVLSFATFSSFFLRQITLINGLGFENWKDDLLAIVYQRTKGGTVNESNVYDKSENILIWDPMPWLPIDWSNMMIIAADKNLGGYIYLCGSVLAFFFLYDLISKKKGFYIISKNHFLLLVTFFISGLFWIITFSGHSFAHRDGETILILAPLFSLIYATLFGQVFINICKQYKYYGSYFTIGFLTCSFLLFISIYEKRVKNLKPLGNFAGSEDLKKYKGYSFGTNETPAIINYFTEGKVSFEVDFQDFVRKKHYWFINKSNKNFHQDYHFLVNNKNDNTKAMLKHLKNYYVQVAGDPSDGDDWRYVIFDMKNTRLKNDWWEIPNLDHENAVFSKALFNKKKEIDFFNLAKNKKFVNHDNLIDTDQPFILNPLTSNTLLQKNTGMTFNFSDKIIQEYGKKNSIILNQILIVPHRSCRSCMFEQALLMGKNGKNWEKIASLKTNQNFNVIKYGSYLWSFNNSKPYKSYKIIFDKAFTGFNDIKFYSSNNSIEVANSVFSEKIQFKYNDASSYKLSFSSMNGATVEYASKMISDNNLDTFWHVDDQKALADGNYNFIDINFEKKNRIKKIAFAPRKNLPNQFFKNAHLFGKNINGDFELISLLESNNKRDKVNVGYYTWEINQKNKYKSYQLRIFEGFEFFNINNHLGNKLFTDNFFSLSEFKIQVF